MQGTARAKFRVEYKDAGDRGSVRLGAVYSDDPNHENKYFWDATPSGSIQMYIANPVAFARFVVGEEVYVDFSDVSTPTVLDEGFDIDELIATEAEFGFETALVLLKEGYKLGRKGWNGKGMFLYHVPAAAYPPSTEIAKKTFSGELVPYGAYIAMKTAQGNVVPWLASQTDLLTNDWQVI